MVGAGFGDGFGAIGGPGKGYTKNSSDKQIFLLQFLQLTLISDKTIFPGFKEAAEVTTCS